MTQITQMGQPRRERVKAGVEVETSSPHPNPFKGEDFD